MSKETQLSEKHWEALRLFETGSHSRAEISEIIGWTRNHLDQLCSGNVQKCGMTASLFKEELKKIEKKRDDRISALVKGNTEKAQKLISEVFDEIDKKPKKTAEDRKVLSMYTNALSKFQPSVSIKNLSYSYVNGLTAEELIHEFKRIKADAESSFERGRVQGITEGRARELSEVDE